MAEFCIIRADGTCENAPNPLKITIANPSDERYRYEGYLEKRYTDAPEYNPETQYLAESWVQDGQYAVQVWTIHELPSEEAEK